MNTNNYFTGCKCIKVMRSVAYVHSGQRATLTPVGLSNRATDAMKKEA